MYDDEDDIPECPLCLDPFELDDVSFFPCTCGYQVCRFCWHRIRTDENGLCPQCRKPYSEDPVRFKPLSNEEILKMKKDRDRRAKEKKGNALDCRKHLANLRVVQPNLLFVVGLTQRMADAELLKRSEYFGRFGKINKLSVTVTTPSNSSATSASASSSSATGSQPPRFSATCHVTYAKAEDALRALLFLDQSQLDSRTLRISIGTTKYCSNFVKGNPCHRKDCTYLHEVGPSDASFTKEAMQEGKHVEYERRLLLDFVARNPNLAQQVDISKINNKTLPTQGNNNNSNNNVTVDSMSSSSSGTTPQQMQSLLSSNSGNEKTSTQLNGTVVKGGAGPQIASSVTSSKQQQVSRSSGGVAVTAGSGGHGTRRPATTSSNNNNNNNSNGSTSQSRVRNRSGSPSAKHRPVAQQPTSKSTSKSKDDASISSSAASSNCNNNNNLTTSSTNNNQHRSSRTTSNKNGATVQQSTKSLISKSTDATITANSLSPSVANASVRPSSSTSSVLKPAARTTQPPVRTSRLTTPDEPVWWNLEPDEGVSSSSASTSPTNGVGLNGKLSPHHVTSETTNSSAAASQSMLPGSSAPSPLLTHGVDSGFVSSSSSTGGSEPSCSIGLTASTNGHHQNVAGNGSLVSLFSTSNNANNGDMLFNSTASNLANADRAIAAILLPSPERTTTLMPPSHHQPLQQPSQPVPLPPGRPIDLKDILRSCAGLTLASSPPNSNNLSTQPLHQPQQQQTTQQPPLSSQTTTFSSNVSDCCDDLDVDPMEESIRRLNDLMAAEQRKKAAQMSTTANANNFPSYSLFQQQQPHGVVGEMLPKTSSSSLLQNSYSQPGISLQNGYNSRLIQQQQQQQPQQSYHPVNSSSLFASYTMQHQHQQQSGAVSSGQSSHFANGNCSSWSTSFNTYNDASPYSQQQHQQRSYGGNSGFGGASSNSINDTSSLTNWLLPSIQTQQQQQQQQMNTGLLGNNNIIGGYPSQQHGSSSYGIQHASSQNRSSANDYLASVFAAVGKHI